MIDILSGYTFLIVAFGTVILAFASGIIGTVSVIKGQSLIGDAVGHATFPGIVIAFMLVGIRDTLSLALGALILGIVAFLTIQLITEHSKITLDSALALVLSSFFGLGMALMSFVQGNPDFDGTQGLSDYIFGQAAYMLRSDVYLIIAASILSLLIFSLFYQQIKIYIFDPIYSRSIGISNPLMNFMVLAITITLIAVGLKAVGAILIVNLLIAPAVIGQLWSDRFLNVLLIAGTTGAIAAFIGTYISTAGDDIATGPAIILVLSAFVVFSMLFSRKGLLRRSIHRRKFGERT
ncbi:metal ABC transporter permease [Salinicoccus roseus]|jgi:manganese/zinc/iron transport system permease protein|uniref:metal ABC transporter permease n=1 Tax=Salinicoccus roseus TaxID=45670 RepID=UPI000FA2DFC7|nr:iron chelate uptake ABC transporter family permease subunit [Salinicoccus roseus]MCG7331490.1 metal ABC transporter permease [Salinicoccus roseus]RPE50912.1 manganese/zinc/iron transport system permease protein [Salinicoccus roseus]GGA79524.1 zinc ABC transporter permease [Salinicoccus roseus]